MNTRIFAGIILSGVLASSAAQAATLSAMEPVEALYSGLSAGEVQKIHMAAEKGMAHKSTCSWHEVETEASNPAITVYLGMENNSFGEKDYLASINQNFVC